MPVYRSGFRPSRRGARPHAILALAASCADADAQAERLAIPDQDALRCSYAVPAEARGLAVAHEAA